MTKIKKFRILINNSFQIINMTHLCNNKIKQLKYIKITNLIAKKL